MDSALSLVILVQPDHLLRPFIELWSVSEFSALKYNLKNRRLPSDFGRTVLSSVL